MFWFLCKTFVWNIYPPKTNLSRYKNTSVLVQSTGYACQILIIIEFPRQIFKKILKYQISWKSVQWEPSCSLRTEGRTERQTGRHDEANIHFSQFYRTHLIKFFDAHWWGFLKLFAFWTLSLSRARARALCTLLNRYCDVWIYAYMRGPCRATESTWPKGETIEVVIESKQPLVVAKLWYVPAPLPPANHQTQNTHNTAEIKTITYTLSFNRKFQRHQKSCVNVLH